MSKPKSVVHLVRQALPSQDKAVATMMVETVAAAIAHGACNGGVVVPGLGSFKVVQRAARRARNPRTGEVVDVAAKTKMVFRPAKTTTRAASTC
ncbi:MAG: HU family DNA-binding protein [Rhodocyclaceae bacterium]|nr:HU family DNA-binding protein [Rhodocyclaceae bacterium]